MMIQIPAAHGPGMVLGEALTDSTGRVGEVMHDTFPVAFLETQPCCFRFGEKTGKSPEIWESRSTLNGSLFLKQLGHGPKTMQNMINPVLK